MHYVYDNITLGQKSITHPTTLENYDFNTLQLCLSFCVL